MDPTLKVKQLFYFGIFNAFEFKIIDYKKIELWVFNYNICHCLYHYYFIIIIIIIIIKL